MKILVLGAAGQIGAYLADSIDFGTQHEAIRWDVAIDPAHDLTSWSEQLEKAVLESDIVMFLAFDVGGSRYLKKYQHNFNFIHNNVRMMEVVFGIVERTSTPVVFASSQMSSMSWSPYGALKKLGELYTKSLDGLVVHFWNVYGVERDKDKYHVISDFVDSALSNGEIRMATDGEESRQFLHAEDCSRALIVIAENYDSIDRNMPLHITSFEWTKISEIAEIVANQCGSVEVIPGTEKDTVQGVMNDPDPSILSLWAPAVSLEEGINEVIQFQKSDTEK